MERETMSKILFTDQEQKILKKHPYVKAISEKAITYTDEFKAMAIKKYEEGKFSRQIFEDAGLEDSRKYHSGRPLERELSIKEKYARLEAQITLLRAENELLKKIDLAERMLIKKKKN